MIQIGLTVNRIGSQEDKYVFVFGGAPSPERTPTATPPRRVRQDVPGAGSRHRDGLQHHGIRLQYIYRRAQELSKLLADLELGRIRP
jgi:hypothetical protein